MTPTSTSERILEAATVLFAERGYADSTISQLAEAAGVSRALLFFHFGSKEGLLDAALSHARVEIASAFEHVRELTGLAALRAFLEVRTQFFQARPHVARLVMIPSEAGASTRSAAAFREFQTLRLALFTRTIAEAVDDGTLRSDIEVAGFAFLLAAACEGDVRMWVSDPTKQPIERTHAAIVQLLELLRSPTPA